MSAKEAVIYIDPFSKSIIKATKNSFEPAKVIKNNFIGSRVGYDDIITYSFKVHKSISEEDLSIQVELRMYEDVGLKTDRKYKIDYIKKELDYEESYIIEVFALDIEEAKKKLSFVFEKTKRLDFLALPNLAFEVFYSNKILSAKKDIFVYLGEKEAFLSIYKDGNYLSSSSLTTLEEVAKDIEIAISNPFSVKTLREVLGEKGLDAKRYDESEQSLYSALHSAFSDIFYKINNIAMHNRSIFGFDTIERIFLSSDDGRITGLREFIKTIGFEETELRDLNLFKQKSKYNFLEHTIASYILQKRLNGDDSNNLTFVEKSKPFYKSKAGSFILFTIFIFIAFGSYPIYLLYQNDILAKQKEVLQGRYEVLKNKTKGIKREIVQNKLDTKKITRAINSQKEKLSNLNKGIDELIALTSQEKKSYKSILLLDNYLKKYNLSLSGFEQKQNNRLILDIIAKYEKRDDIAKFMKDLIDIGFVEVSTKEIKLNENYYISKIEIEK